MSFAGWAEIVLFLVVLTALTPVVGGYMARVFTGERVFLTPVLGPVERLALRAFGVRPERGQDWKAYARSMLLFSALFWGLLYLILRTQTLHPFNPLDLSSGTWDNSFSVASSFLTNTNWQFYGGETTMTYFSQMAGLAVQNFVSAAVGIAVLVALIRGLISRSGHELGNFWVDLTRSLLYILLPLSVVGALVLMSQGVIQSLGDYMPLTTITGLGQTLAARAGGRPGGDQGAGHQRRRLLQRELRDAVREPHLVLQLRRDAADPDHPGGPDGHVRPDGGLAPAGLGHLRGDDDHVHRRGLGDLRRRVELHGRDGRGGGQRREPGGQGAAVRHRLLVAVHAP